jgi:acetyltransferase-like isoleucine patch superfamily enzyme
MSPGVLSKARALELSWRHPRLFAHSLRLSAAYSLRKTLDMPIVAAPGSSIDRRPGGRLELGGQLFLGYDFGAERKGRKGLPVLGPAFLEVDSGGRLTTGGWTLFGPGTRISVGQSAEMQIGEGTYVSSDTRLLCRRSIVIGADCAISWEVLIMDNDAHCLSVDGERRPQAVRVHIGHHVWVGARATILKGTTIGDGAIIAAGAVVTKDVPPACVAAGNPAVVVRKDAEWY